jgi:hypothetical protein
VRNRHLLLSSLLCCLACASVPDSESSALQALGGVSEERALNQLFGMNEGDCTRPIALEPHLRQYVLTSGTVQSVRFPEGAAQPIVIASPANAYGVFLFRRELKGWQTYFVAAGSLTQALRLSRDGQTLYVVSMWSREAPGDYRVTSVPAGSGPLSCATLRRPEFQRSLDHGAFAALAIDERGQGNLVTRATIEREERSDVEWYRYRTQDDGKSFLPAERRGPPSEPLVDLPAPSSLHPDPALLAELMQN